MLRKAFSGLTLMTLLMSMFTLALNVQVVKAFGTIYIRADGSVYPPTAPILNVDNVTYIFQDNIEDSVVVERSNITIDGNGYTLQGLQSRRGGNGFYLNAVNNVTIKRTNIKEFAYGVYISNSSYNTLYENNITNNGSTDPIIGEWFGGVYLHNSSHDNLSGNYFMANIRTGIVLDGASDVSISGNILTDNGYGVVLLRSSNSILSENNMTNNRGVGVGLFRSLNISIFRNNVTRTYATAYGGGVYLVESSKTVLSANVISNNGHNLGVGGIELSHFIHSIDSSNLVNGKPVYYLINYTDSVINSSTHPKVGYLALINSTNVTVEGLTLTNNVHGLLLAYTNSSNIRYNNITNNVDGIRLWRSYSNILSKNNVSINGYGIWIDSSSSNGIVQNNITNNLYGIELENSSNNSIFGNNITNNELHSIEFYSSSDNSIVGNMITNSRSGVKLSRSSNNKFCHNNFINNTYQADLGKSYDNVWDDGYPSGGNYWSDHNPPDLFSGPYQNETGSDGIGDTPYIINQNNTDRYPLIYPYYYVPSPDINNDGTINRSDLETTVVSFGSAPGDSKWNPYTDLNQDEIIDIFDLVIIAVNFGKPYP